MEIPKRNIWKSSEEFMEDWNMGHSTVQSSPNPCFVESNYAKAIKKKMHHSKLTQKTE